MMGTSYSTFYFSWLIRFMISYLIISIASMAILKFLIFKNSDFILLVIWHYLFCLSLISQSFFLSSFFTNAKLSVIISMIFFIINFMVIFLMQNNSNATIVTQYISSISPHNAFSISSQILIDY
jgi:ATP-binding cassette subfamily A (ABC1) protein 3